MPTFFTAAATAVVTVLTVVVIAATKALSTVGGRVLTCKSVSISVDGAGGLHDHHGSGDGLSDGTSGRCQAFLRVAHRHGKGVRVVMRKGLVGER